MLSSKNLIPLVISLFLLAFPSFVCAGIDQIPTPEFVAYTAQARIIVSLIFITLLAISYGSLLTAFAHKYLNLSNQKKQLSLIFVGTFPFFTLIYSFFYNMVLPSTSTLINPLNNSFIDFLFLLSISLLSPLAWIFILAQLLICFILVKLLNRMTILPLMTFAVWTMLFFFLFGTILLYFVGQAYLHLHPFIGKPFLF